MEWEPAHRDTVVEMLARSVAANPDKVAVWFGDAPVTYRQLLERSTSTAAKLIELGVGPGDAIAVLMQNAAEHIYCLFGAAMINAVESSINTAYVGDFLNGLLQRINARVLLVDDDLLPNVVAVLNDLPELRTLLVRQRSTSPAGEVVIPERVQVLDIASLVSVKNPAPHKTYDPRWDLPSSIQYTSGTTGPSKAALFSQNYVVHLAREYSAWWYRDQDDVFYTGLPLFHGMAKLLGVLGAIYRGVTCVLDERFSVSQFWQRVADHHATATCSPEAVLNMLWNQPVADLEAHNTLHTIVAAPIPAQLHRQMEQRWGIRFVSQYSLSEVSPLVDGGTVRPLEPGTAGLARSEFYDVRIFNELDEEMPVGEVGEVVVRPLRPKIMFDGYCGDPEATLQAWRNLWFHTGDLGSFDDAGVFRFFDRKKDYIRRRAENISSFEVQRAVLKHRAVADVAAVGVASEMGEQEVKVCVVTADGQSPTPEELLEHCARNMPYYAVPRYIEFLDELPTTPSGKVSKHPLRENNREGIPTWDREAAGLTVDRAGKVAKLASQASSPS